MTKKKDENSEASPKPGQTTHHLAGAAARSDGEPVTGAPVPKNEPHKNEPPEPTPGPEAPTPKPTMRGAVGSPPESGFGSQKLPDKGEDPDPIGTAFRVREKWHENQAKNEGKPPTPAAPLPLPIEHEDGTRARQYEQLHPKLRDALEAASAFLATKKGRKGLFITDSIRSVPEQQDIYAKFWQGIFSDLLGGKKLEDIRKDQRAGASWLLGHMKAGSYWTQLLKLITSGSFAPHREVVDEIRDKFQQLFDELRTLALKKFTWHWCRCAVDLRTTGSDQPRMTQSEAEELEKWFEIHVKDDTSKWEVILHDVDGPHLHVAIIDEEWKAEYAPNLRSTHA